MKEHHGVNRRVDFEENVSHLLKRGREGMMDVYIDLFESSG